MPASIALAALFALLPLAGCGDNDTTTLLVEQTEDAPLAPEPLGESRAFGVLARPDSLDAVCRFIGVSSVGGTGDRTACAGVVEDCRDDVSTIGAEGAAPAPGVPPANLQALLGCPLTLAQLDACIGAALERGIEEYGSAIGCDMPALPEVDPIRLLASPDCFAVVLSCPQLIASLVPPR